MAWQAWRGYDRLFYFRDYAGALFDLDATDTLTWDQVDYPQNISVDYLRGLCYMGLKDYDRAIEYFKKFAEDEATKVGEEFIDEAVFLYLGKIYFERLEMSKAEHYLRRGLKFEDSFADFNYYLAQIYCYKNDLFQAREELNTAIKKFEDGNRLRGYRFEAIGQLYKSDLDEFSILLGDS